MLRESGLLGVLSGRGAFFLLTYQDWRYSLLREMYISAFLDLGFGAFEGPIVETVAFTGAVGRHGREDTLFVNLLDTVDREKSLCASFSGSIDRRQFIVNTNLFESIPSAPFSYWFPRRIHNLFQCYPPLKGDNATVSQGMSTTDDFRYLRLFSEVPSLPSGSWPAIAKGGDYATYYSDLALRVNWKNNGHELHANSKSVLRNKSCYFRPGITWTEGTTSCFSARALPAKSAISGSGQGLYEKSNNHKVLLGILAYLNTNTVYLCLEAMVSSGDFSQAGGVVRHYTTDLLGRIPIPCSELLSSLSEYCKRVYFLQAEGARNEEFNTLFVTPFVCCDEMSSLRAATVRRVREEIDRRLEALRNVDQIEALVSDWSGINAESAPDLLPPSINSFTNEHVSVHEILQLSGLSEAVLVERAFRNFPMRKIMKLGAAVDRQTELICYALEVGPEGIRESLREGSPLVQNNLPESARNNNSYMLGSVLGRWDIRYTIGERTPPPLPDPFDPLPVCPPGMLQNTEGLPAEPKDVPADYPLRITWSGILVDDEGHPEDIVKRVREAMEVIWKDKAGDIEQEACEILKVKTLRDYFAKPANFFADHLKRYSKSRRQAPIYWPLSSDKGSYTLWLYYHGLSDQILYTCVNDYVEPKLRQVADAATALRNKQNRSGKDEKDVESLTDLELELKDFRDELLRIAEFWKPNLNDGVQITAAPLWKLFKLSKWQKTLKKTWEKLEKGDYDWAHLAYSIWPDRVREKCKSDKSLAIAHECEELYVEPPDGKKKRGKRKKKAEVEGEV